MPLKIAISGKGGVGKTTASALIARLLAEQGKRVFAIDADPVTNLAVALGIPEDPPITPIVELGELIEERTGAKPGTSGGFFSLNPRVDDIPERFSKQRDNVHLLVMGTVKSGGSGCICPENSMLRALVTHLFLYQNDAIIMDMEAGVEHLGRATAKSVDWLIMVVDTGRRSQTTAQQIVPLAEEIGIPRIAAIGNKVQSEDDIKRMREMLPDVPFIGYLPMHEEIIQADREGRRAFEDLSQVPEEMRQVVNQLLKDKE